VTSPSWGIWQVNIDKELVSPLLNPEPILSIGVCTYFNAVHPPIVYTDAVSITNDIWACRTTISAGLVRFCTKSEYYTLVDTEIWIVGNLSEPRHFLFRYNTYRIQRQQTRLEQAQGLQGRLW
jgi:hypothetical protein